MKKFLKPIAALAGLAILAVIVMIALMPWMDRWGATGEEIAASFTGDELVPAPRLTYTRAISIQATPEEIYTWIVQLGAERGGMYSYEWFETNVLRCELINADRIHEEWQNLKVGDQVKMCPGTSGPPPYEVAMLEPNHAMILGHKEKDEWIEVWQFILVPQRDGSTRLILRSRNAAQGWLWDVIRPGEFIMARGMLLGIKERAEGMTPAQEPQNITEPATATPEIFNPLNPSPTPSDSTLPLTCQVTDLNVYVNEEWSYCFAYPKDFTLNEYAGMEGSMSLYGPDVEADGQRLRASLEVTVQPVPQGSELTPLVNAYLNSFHDLPSPIRRAASSLGSEPAEILEPVPGLLSSRVVMTLHRNVLFTLRFHPSDIDVMKLDLDAVVQTVTGSFTFLSKVAMPVLSPKMVNWYEFEQNISLTYDPILAPWVEMQTVPEVPVSDQVLFSESHPAYAQIRFLGVQGGKPYELPLLPAENRIAQVMVFQTTDFPGFGDNHPLGFVNQLEALQELLQTGLEPSQCARPIPGEYLLPFLPWVNAHQSFCSQPQVIEFSGGKGIRYLTHYSQGPNPVLEQHVFYTFQGLTDDGKFYLSVLFPVQTGIFPLEPPACEQCGEPNYDPFPELTTMLTRQLNQLQVQPADQFAPPLLLLDDLIRSIRIGS
jgi:hypothetical protein